MSGGIESLDHVNYINEVAKEGTEEDLREALRIIRRMRGHYQDAKRAGSTKYDKALELAEKAIAMEDWAVAEIKKREAASLSGEPLSFDEEQVIKALKETALGREGLIFKEMFRGGDPYKALMKLMKRGIVVDIEPHRRYNHLPNHDHVGLADEEYPSNSEDWQDFRDTGASLDMSFGEFKKKRAAGEFKWLAKNIAEFIDKDITKVWKTKYDSGDTFWVNFAGKLVDREYLLEDIRNDLPAEECLFNQLVRAFDSEEFDYFKVNVLDKAWHDKMIDARIAYIEKTIAELKAE